MAEGSLAVVLETNLTLQLEEAKNRETAWASVYVTTQLRLFRLRIVREWLIDPQIHLPYEVSNRVVVTACLHAANLWASNQVAGNVQPELP